MTILQEFGGSVIIVEYVCERDFKSDSSCKRSLGVVAVDVNIYQRKET